MSGIQSAIGVITGIPIQDTVNQLIAISAKPRDSLIQRTAVLKQQQVAFTEITALVVGVQLSARNLKTESVYQAVSVASNRPEALAASASGAPAVGTYNFRTLAVAQQQQRLSGRIDSDQEAIGAGSLRLRSGGFLDDPLTLDRLNGGEGVERGRIRITDRSGATAMVDLRYARTIDDVLNRINEQSTINVTASIEGDRIRLTDNTGASLANLSVQQVGSESTAADLGLAGVNVAASSALGNDVISLTSATRLAWLNDGEGIDRNSTLPEIEVRFRDGSSPLQIELGEAKTIGDVLTAINSAAPARLRAEIAPDGDRIRLVDLTTNSGGTFEVVSLHGGTTAADLGLSSGTVSGDTITGKRVQSGLNSVLVSRLGGGQGLGQLGVLSLTNRAGVTANVDLSAAETLTDVISTINAAGISVRAELNASKSGLTIVDSSGGTGNLIVQNGGDALATATKLRIAGNVAATTLQGSSLDRRTLGVNTPLSELNNGKGISSGSFTITDSSGAVAAVNLAVDGIETLGDVIDAVNGLSIGVEARLNQTGDGLLLLDTAGGSGKFSVSDSGGGKAAADLRLTGESKIVDIGTGPRQGIDGSFASTIEIDADDKLDDVITKINQASAGVTASKFFDGMGYRISLTSNRSGMSGRVQLDVSGTSLDFNESVAARDAMILVGSDEASGAGVLATSSTNQFDKVIDGLSLTVKAVSSEATQVSVSATDTRLVTNVKLFVEQYNKLVDKLAEVTKFEDLGSATAPNVKTGLLFGSSELLRMENQLDELISGRIAGAGAIRSIAELGLDLGENGKLTLDEEKLKQRFAADPEAVKSFFSTESSGFAMRMDTAIDRIAGLGDSLLLVKFRTLQQKIDFNTERAASLTERLDRQKAKLLKQFYTLEESIQKIKSFQSSLAAIQPLPPLTSA